MSKRYRLIRLSLFFLLFYLFFLTSCSEDKVRIECTDPLYCVDVAPGESIRLGVLQALSGKVKPLGEAQIRGLELAIDAKKGQLFGHDIELMIVDTGCTAEGGANAVLKIIADPKVVAIYGTTCSGAAATAARAMSESGMTMISGNNSAPFLTSIAGKPAPNWQPGYFRTANNEENAGKAVAEYAYLKLGIRRAATIHDNDIYTKGLTDGFQKAFTSLGGEIVLKTSVDKGDDVMEPVLTAVSDAKAELMFFPLFQPEGNNILLQARKMPAFDKILLVSDGALIEETFLDTVGAAAEGMYFVGPATPEGIAVDQMAVTYEAKYKTPPGVSYYMSGYDAALLLLNALEKVTKQEKDGTLHIGRKSLRDALYAVKAFRGVTGNLSCDQFGDCGPANFNVLRLDDLSLGIKGLQSNIVHSYNPE